MPANTRIITLTDIEEAATLIQDKAHRTPVLSCRTLDRIAHARLFFKCENFQKVGAFKFRGALNAVLHLDEAEKGRGVATHSSGNHAQALALAAKMNNMTAHIVMPSNSSPVKIKAVEGYGAQITFCEPTLDARESTLRNVMKKTGAVEIHPYNNYNIIAGQATAAKELLEQKPELDYILAPVGGGGLLSGTALAAHYISPKTKVIAVEPEMADDAYRSFKSRTFVPSVNPATIADGLRTSLGDITLNIMLSYVYDVVTVSEQAIIDAMRLIWERMKIIVEPSSAVVLAALLQNKLHMTGRDRIGLIISGGNVDLTSTFESLLK